MSHQFKSLIFILLFHFVLAGVTAQDSLFFESFEGEVLFIPSKELEKGYGDHVHDNRIISGIILKNLNIPSQKDDLNFPGVDRKAQFGILANSQIYAAKEGCYEIDLGSDDGSILWIDGYVAIDNDSPHRMRHVKDTIKFTKGEHDARLWYYNAYPNRYGLMLNSRLLHDSIRCQKLENSNATKVGHTEKFTLSNQVLFQTADHVLRDSAEEELQRVAVALRGKVIRNIKIEGFTDDVGESQYNDELSLRRALSVKAYFISALGIEESVFTIHGFGENQPITLNDTEEGRQKNRRVEVIVWYE